MTAQQREFRVSPDEAESRLDAFVAARARVSRAAAAKLISAGSVLVDGRAATKSSSRVGKGMRVAVSLPAAEDASPQPEDIPVAVVFEDEHLLVVSKPAGLVVHPAPGHSSGTLVNALLARAGAAPAGGDAERPGIVHRLDAGTSGLMIVAKDEATHAALTEALAARAITRIYLALVEGIPDSDTMTIDAPVGRSPRDRKKMAVVAGGRPAVTEIKVVEKFPDTALVEARPITGRTHQIRVHLKAADHPVAGDRVYGHNRKLAAALGLDRPFLHAARLSFEHPSTGARIELEDPLPADLQAALQAARMRR
ncbi:MAG TPA: RluA family pseudouridine synthase [Actinomycetota bacterium]|nr:RluA family pseudouridine synthase [Actinomycetota bacterium]